MAKNRMYNNTAPETNKSFHPSKKVVDAARKVVNQNSDRGPTWNGFHAGVHQDKSGVHYGYSKRSRREGKKACMEY